MFLALRDSILFDFCIDSAVSVSFAFFASAGIFTILFFGKFGVITLVTSPLAISALAGSGHIFVYGKLGRCRRSPYGTPFVFALGLRGIL